MKWAAPQAEKQEIVKIDDEDCDSVPLQVL